VGVAAGIGGVGRWAVWEWVCPCHSVCFLLIDIDTRVPAARCCQAIAIKTSAACDACYNENPLNQIMCAQSPTLRVPRPLPSSWYTGKSGEILRRSRGTKLSGTFITQQILQDSAQINCSSFRIGFWLSGNKQQTDSTIKNAAECPSSFAADFEWEYIVGGKYKWIWMAFHSRQTWIYNERYWRIMAVNAFIKTILLWFAVSYGPSGSGHVPL